MNHVVQFTKWIDFIEDVASAQEVAGIYHELIEQRTAVGQYGSSRWLLTTVIRAIVVNGSVTHVAALTIPHGREVERLYGRIIGPPGEEEKTEAGRWRIARERHEKAINALARLIGGSGLSVEAIRGGIVNVPADLSFVLVEIPIDEAGQAMTLVTPDDPNWGVLQEVLERQKRDEEALNHTEVSG